MQIFKDLSKATTLEGLIDETTRQATRLGALGFVYCGRAHYSLATSRAVTFTSMADLLPPLRAELRNGADPFTGSMQRTLLPRERPLQGCFDRDTPIFALLVSKGVRSALVVPLPGRDGGSLTLLYGEQRPALDSASLLREAMYVTTLVAERVRLIALATSSPEEARSFTTRELEIIEYFLAGATIEETASALSVSITGARFHLNNIYSKIGAANQRQAVARLVELGYLRRGNMSLLGSEWAPRSSRGGKRSSAVVVTQDRRRVPRAEPPAETDGDVPLLGIYDEPPALGPRSRPN